MPEDKDKIIIEIEEESVLQRDKKKTIRVLVFLLGGENYCVPIYQAKAVIRLPEITHVPNTPEFVIGIINLSGEIISVMDIRYFLGLAQGNGPRDKRILITDASGSSVGIAVDRIKSTLEIEEDSIQPPLPTLKGKLAEYTKGEIKFGDEILVLLDLEAILKNEELKELRKGKEG